MASTRSTSEISGAEASKENTMVDNVAACDSCRRTKWACIGGPVCEKCALWGFDCMYTAGDAITDLRKEFAMLLLPGLPIPPRNNFEEADENLSRKTTSLPNAGATESSFQEESSTEDDAFETLDPYGSSVHQQLRKCRCPRCSRRYVVSEPGGDKARLCPRCRTRRCKTSYCPPTEALESRSRAFAEERRRARHANACDSCRSLDFKCNEVQPCYMCRTNGTECTYKSAHSNSNHSYSPSQTPDSITQRPFELQLRLRRQPRPADSLPLPPYHSSAPPLCYESLLGPPIAYAYNYHYTAPFTPYTSIPSGCTNCFESKTRCSRPCGFPCTRCAETSLECMPFPAGTRLAPCEACTRTKRLCTNVQKGLSCDGCVDVGLECSRLKIVGVGGWKQEGETEREEKGAKEDEEQAEVGDRLTLSIRLDTEQEGSENEEVESLIGKKSTDSSLHAGLKVLIQDTQPLGEHLSEDQDQDNIQADYGWCMITHEEVTGMESGSEESGKPSVVQ